MTKRQAAMASNNVLFIPNLAKGLSDAVRHINVRYLIRGRTHTPSSIILDAEFLQNL
jgi:hypothetical protein